MRRLQGVLATKSELTYDQRLRLLDVTSADSVVKSFKAYIGTHPPIGSALPMRAAALRCLKDKFGMKQADADDLLEPTAGLKAGSMRFALSREQMKAFVQEVRKLDNPPVQVALMIMASTGMRPEEVCNLPRNRVRKAGDDYKLEVHGKSKEHRLVLVCGEIAKLLTRQLNATGGPWVFTGETQGNPLSTQALRRVVSGYVNRKKFYPGIAQRINEPRLTPYILRHTFATFQLEDKVDMETISRMMGHASTRTTSQYLHLADTAGDAAMRQFVSKVFG